MSICENFLVVTSSCLLNIWYICVYVYIFQYTFQAFMVGGGNYQFLRKWFDIIPEYVIALFVPEVVIA